jgi:hypothetical protein
MVARIIATIESVRMGASMAPAVIEIDEIVPLHVNGAVLYAREVRVEPLEPEWEIELAA